MGRRLPGQPSIRSLELAFATLGGSAKRAELIRVVVGVDVPLRPYAKAPAGAGVRFSPAAAHSVSRFAVAAQSEPHNVVSPASGWSARRCGSAGMRPIPLCVYANGHEWARCKLAKAEPRPWTTVCGLSPSPPPPSASAPPGDDVGGILGPQPGEGAIALANSEHRVVALEAVAWPVSLGSGPASRSTPTWSSASAGRSSSTEHTWNGCGAPSQDHAQRRHPRRHCGAICPVVRGPVTPWRPSLPPRADDLAPAVPRRGPLRLAARVGIGPRHAPYWPPPSELRASAEDAA